jgi:hypothetical protein
MENRIYKHKNGLPRSQSSTRHKFKEISRNGFNELNSKYELYKQGSPNTYSEDLGTLKANSIKGDIAMMELPAIDYIIN